MELQKMLKPFSNLIIILQFFFALSVVQATNFSFYCLGNPSKASKQVNTAAFDGKGFSTKSRILWDQAAKGVGMVINFSREIDLAKLEVVTSKPNQFNWLPEKTEFYFWDSSKLTWKLSETVNDNSGRGKDKKKTFLSVESIWNPKEKIKTKSVKILMYGKSIWLSEINMFERETNGRVKKLKFIEPDISGMTCLVPNKNCVASGSSVDINVWRVNGIGGRWLAVGQPNHLDRKDKVTFSFDLEKYINKGKIRRAILCYSQNLFGSKYRSEEILLKHFTTERMILKNNDLVSNQVNLIGDYIVDKGLKTSLDSKIDVTQAINADLQKGAFFSTFRLESLSAEKLGNPGLKPVGISILNKSIKLYIKPF